MFESCYCKELSALAIVNGGEIYLYIVAGEQAFTSDFGNTFW